MPIPGENYLALAPLYSRWRNDVAWWPLAARCTLVPALSQRLATSLLSAAMDRGARSWLPAIPGISIAAKRRERAVRAVLQTSPPSCRRSWNAPCTGRNKAESQRQNRKPNGLAKRLLGGVVLAELILTLTVERHLVSAVFGKFGLE